MNLNADRKMPSLISSIPSNLNRSIAAYVIKVQIDTYKINVGYCKHRSKKVVAIVFTLCTIASEFSLKSGWSNELCEVDTLYSSMK